MHLIINNNTMILTSGYIGSELVTAIIYDGADFGLSHYYYKGKCYAGTVKFDSVVSESHIA
jgi:hypothetical protein